VKPSLRALLALVTMSVVVASCGAPSPGGGAIGTVERQPLPEGAVVVLAAGDIAECGSQGDDATAAVIAAYPEATVLALGDLAYPAGSTSDFARCYDPSWGAHRDRTRPVPGNHEYQTLGAGGYYAYFGERAGPDGRGYYSFDLGDWHLVALNSERDVRDGGRQLEWLRADLEGTKQRCVLAYWHRPRFTGGRYADFEDVAPLWETLARAGAEVVLVGHDHNYQRYAPLDARGAFDERGVRQFVVGTGGKDRYALAPDPRREAGSADAYGVLRLVLRPDGYDWAFLAAPGSTYTDSGSGSCR
jgi:acid phosphatase type 7